MISAELVKELREKTGAGIMDCKKALVECNGDMEKSLDYLREKGIAKATKKADRIATEGLANIYVSGNKAVILEVNSETDYVSKNEEFISMLDEIGNAILNSDAKDYESALNVKTNNGTVSELIVAKISKIGEKLSFRRCEIITKADDEVFGKYLHLGGRIAVLSVLKGANEDVARDVAMQAAAMRPKYVFSSEVPESVLEREKNVFKEQAINEGKPADIAEKMVAGRVNKFYKEVCLADQDFIKESGVSVSKYVANNGGEIKLVVRYEVGEGMEKKSENFAEEVMNQVNGK